jgi:hypothetical protein
LCISKGGSIDPKTTENVEIEDQKIPTLANPARIGHPAKKISALRSIEPAA